MNKTNYKLNENEQFFMIRFLANNGCGAETPDSLLGDNYSCQSMERFNAPEELVTQTLLEASKKDNFSIGMQLQSYVFRLAFYAIVGLIVALIVKKTNTSEA